MRPASAEVGDDVEVDLERLRPLALLGEHAADADDPQAAQLDPVGHRTAGVRHSSSRATPDELAADRADLAVHQALDQRRGLGPVRHHAGPHDVAGDDPGDPVTELVAVEEHLLAVGDAAGAAR